MERKSKMPFWVGIIAFAVCIIWQIAASLILPQELGLYRSAILEVGLLIIAVIPVLIMRIPFKEVFPFRKPLWNHLLAIPILYYASAYLLSVITYLTGYFFPGQMMDVMNYIDEATSSVPGWASFIIMAFAAPLCEEPFHRGLIQYSTGRFRSPAWRVILVGIIFGIFHLEPYRFFITGAMGVLLAYLMLETENLLIPMLFHFFNNAISAASSLVAFDPSLLDTSMFSEGMLGIFLCLYGTVGPFILYGGVRLLTFRNGKPFPHKKFLITAGCIAGISLIAGIILFLLGMDDILQMIESTVSEFAAGGSL